ncbi:MAG: hypothetical protein RMM28_07670 [Thermoleophilia bacterium]|nr:hypothetical protein [Gaiellaceae bacterium]MDW8338997.1 hypothetical protein [Thermoleophilia bacterium]
MEGSGRGDYLVFLWLPTGYALEERQGGLPPPGAEVEEHSRRYRVAKVAPSPLPEDPRPCVYLVPA